MSRATTTYPQVTAFLGCFGGSMREKPCESRQAQVGWELVFPRKEKSLGA